jgi:hypothetical protein
VQDIDEVEADSGLPDADLARAGRRQFDRLVAEVRRPARSVESDDLL